MEKTEGRSGGGGLDIEGGGDRLAVDNQSKNNESRHPLLSTYYALHNKWFFSYVTSPMGRDFQLFPLKGTEPVKSWLQSSKRGEAVGGGSLCVNLAHFGGSRF